MLAFSKKGGKGKKGVGGVPTGGPTLPTFVSGPAEPRSRPPERRIAAAQRSHQRQVDAVLAMNAETRSMALNGLAALADAETRGVHRPVEASPAGAATPRPALTVAQAFVHAQELVRASAPLDAQLRAWHLVYGVSEVQVRGARLPGGGGEGVEGALKAQMTALTSLADLYNGKGQVRSAVNALERVLELAFALPSSPQLLISCATVARRLAKLHASVGGVEAARKYILVSASLEEEGKKAGGVSSGEGTNPGLAAPVVAPAAAPVAAAAAPVAAAAAAAPAAATPAPAAAAPAAGKAVAQPPAVPSPKKTAAAAVVPSSAPVPSPTSKVVEAKAAGVKEQVKENPWGKKKVEAAVAVPVPVAAVPEKAGAPGKTEGKQVAEKVETAVDPTPAAAATVAPTPAASADTVAAAPAAPSPALAPAPTPVPQWSPPEVPQDGSSLSLFMQAAIDVMVRGNAAFFYHCCAPSECPPNVLALVHSPFNPPPTPHTPHPPHRQRTTAVAW